MGYPVTHTITRGEDIRIEVRLVGDDITDADPSITVSDDLLAGTFHLSRTPPDTIVIRCLDTSAFPVGTHDLDLWIDWPDGEVTKEMVQDFRIVIEPTGDALADGGISIDGGAPEQEYEGTIDGGPA